MKYKKNSRYPLPSMENACIETHKMSIILPGDMRFWTLQKCPKSGTPPSDITKNMSQNTLFCVILYKFTPKYSKKQVNFCDWPVTAKSMFLVPTDFFGSKIANMRMW